jgi:hypothetical protein
VLLEFSIRMSMLLIAGSLEGVFYLNLFLHIFK